MQTVQHPRIPIYFGGASDTAIRVPGKHADVNAPWNETWAQVAEITSRMRAEAAKHARQVRFSLSFRPTLGATEAEAWAKAEAILADIQRTWTEAPLGPPAATPANAGSQRLCSGGSGRPAGRAAVPQSPM